MRLFLGLLLLGTGCSTVSKTENLNGISAQRMFVKADSRIGAYMSVPSGFETMSYWIEGPTGLLLIDTQFLLSAGDEAVEFAEKSTGKKVELAIVLHPNPDKFNGVARLKKRGIRVVTSDQVVALIPEIHKDRHHWFYDRYKPDYPDQYELPDSFGSKTTKLEAGGVTVTAHVLGSGCSGAHVVVQFERSLFVGDLVSNGNHSWLELGLTDHWLMRIGELRKMAPERIYLGRGYPGGTELLDKQEHYLKTVNSIVRAASPKGDPTEQQLERLQKTIESKFPGYGYELFSENGLPEIWRRMANGSFKR